MKRFRSRSGGGFPILESMKMSSIFSVFSQVGGSGPQKRGISTNCLEARPYFSGPLKQNTRNT